MPEYLAQEEPVLIWTGKVMLDGRLTVPSGTAAVVVVAGLGGTWHHPGYRAIASHLSENGFATIVSDLLTPDEQQFDARTGHFRVDLPFLAHRVSDIVQWVERNEITRDLPVAYFGSGASGSAGLLAANKGLELFGLVLNAARVDMLREENPAVPSLLLVDDDSASLLLEMKSPGGEDRRITAISGSTGLMEPTEALESIIAHTVEWLRERVPQLVA